MANGEWGKTGRKPPLDPYSLLPILRLLGFREGVEQLVPAERLVVGSTPGSSAQKRLELADNCVRAKPGAQEPPVEGLDGGGLVQGLADTQLAAEILAEESGLVHGFKAAAEGFVGNVRADPRGGEVAAHPGPAFEAILDARGDEGAGKADVVEEAVIAEPREDGFDVGLGGLAAEEQGAHLGARMCAAGQRADSNLIQ